MRSDAEQFLKIVQQAQQECARRPCLSTVALIQAASAGVPFQQAVTAAVSTLGGLHAPLLQTRQLLYRTSPAFSGRIPGFGSSFVKGEPDPIWKESASLVATYWPEVENLLQLIQDELQDRGKNLYPNAAAYTAIAAHELGISWGAELSLLLEARMPVWADLYGEHVVRWEES